MKLHIQGMGLTGSLLAYFLHTATNVEFTWSDTDAPRTAWRASTGAIYPAGSMKFGPDRLCYDVWAQWNAEGILGSWTERSSYWFMTKSAPHQGAWKFDDANEHGLRRLHADSYHFCAQSFVPHMRECLQGLRTDGPAQGEQLVVAHGFGQRLARAYWGWTRLVKLGYDDQYLSTFDEGIGMRPCVYLRPNKVQMAYVYPVPGTPWWYAGSSIIAQRPDRMRSLEMQPKYERWRRDFLALSGGAFTIEEEGQFIEGWRPAAGPEDHAWTQWSADCKELRMRPLWNSGIRHFPMQLAQTLRALQLPVPHELEPLLAA